MFSYLIIALFALAVSSHPLYHSHSLANATLAPSSFPSLSATTTDDCSQTTPSTPAPPTTSLAQTTPALPTTSVAPTTSAAPTSSVASTPVTLSPPVSTSTVPAGSSYTTSSAYTGGIATYFYQNGNPGACGQVHSDSNFICAMDQTRFGTSGPASPLCGMQVYITNTNTGQSITVTVADDCPTCMNENSIDLSVGAFSALAPTSEGTFPIQWSYV